MKINFLTFGSDNNYVDAANRLLEQANKLDLFSEKTLVTKDDLKNDTLFWNLHNKFIDNNKKRFWILVMETLYYKKNMEKMENGDILLYLDCGCEIDITKKDVSKDLIQIVKKI